MRYSDKRSGFTLVELSIVLVIIGLIVASVLVGQDLVRQAELRSTITQYEQFQAAVKTFRTKYNALPGDIQGATLYGWTGNGGNALSGTNPAAGSNDLLEPIANGLGAASTAADNVFFWSHLGAGGAGMISGTWAGAAVTAGSSSNIASVLPEAKAGNYWGVYSESGVNYYYIGATAAPATLGQYYSTLTLLPTDALSIDTKVDDGRPGRGIVQARGDFANATDAAPLVSSAVPTNTGTTCGYEATATPVFLDSFYNTAETSAACTLQLRF